MNRFLVFLLGCSAAFLVPGCGGSDPAPIEIGDPAPNFSLRAVGNATGTITSQQLRGKIAIINFWSTTCGVCLNETKELARVHGTGKAEVVGIALETNADYVARFVKDRGIGYPIALGNEDVFARYEGYAIPYTIVVDRSGAIRLRVYGGIEADELTKIIDKIDRTSVALAPARSTQATH
jgi:peroxiredoxin